MNLHPPAIFSNSAPFGSSVLPASAAIPIPPSRESAVITIVVVTFIPIPLPAVRLFHPLDLTGNQDLGRQRQRLRTRKGETGESAKEIM